MRSCDRWGCGTTLAMIGAAAACGRIEFESADPRLATIELWASPEARLSTPLSPTFDPSLGSYVVDVGLALESVQVSATPLVATTDVLIGGVPSEAGALSSPIELDLGSNVLEVAGRSATGATAIYSVEIRRADQLAQDGYFKASNTGSNDNFGYAVALSGDTLAVSAIGEASSATGIDGNQADETALNSGAVYVFVRAGSTWAQQAYLKASNTGRDDRFGFAIALAGDTLAVSAHLEDSSATGVDGNQADDGAVQSGAVYVFAREGSAWTQQAYLKASNTETGDNFGYSIALSSDTLAVGAFREAGSTTGIGGLESDNSAPDSGAVYVFARAGSTWTQQAYVKASNTETGDNFGYSVALSGDTLAAGAPFEDSGATGIDGNQADNSAVDSGAIYVFVRSGQAWSQQAYVKASNTDPSDSLGRTVSISGNTLVAGSFFESSSATGVGGNQTDNGAAQSGAVYVFHRDETLWSQQAYLKASNTRTFAHFGYSVAVSGDTLAVGARDEASSATGIDGNQVDTGASSSGAAYLFVRSSSTWSQRAYVKASNTGIDDTLGFAIALSSDTFAVGATGEASSATGVGGDQSDNSAVQSGAVYVFR